MFKPDSYKKQGCDPRNNYTPVLKPDYHMMDDPEYLYKTNKYDPDSFWDGETIDEENI